MIWIVVTALIGFLLVTIRVFIRSYRTLQHRVTLLEYEIQKAKPVVAWHTNRIVKEGRE